MHGLLATQLWDNPVEVNWVGRSQIGDVIKAFGYYLLRGLKAADLGLVELADNLAEGLCWMGVAYETAPTFRPLGLWVTDLQQDDNGVKFATIYALSGERLPTWMPQVEALVTTFAQANQCTAVRFFGRAAYKALVQDLEIISKTEDGRALLFEKKIAAFPGALQ